MPLKCTAPHPHPCFRSVCSGFNLVNELSQQVAIMRMEAENTHDRRVRSQLEGVITTIEGVMDAVKLAGPQKVSFGVRGALTK